MNSTPTSPESRTPRLLQPDEGPFLAAAGDTYRMLVDGRHTGGNFALIEIRVLPGGGPPPHLHRNEDETFYILEGELQLWVDGRTLNAAAGACVFAPRGIPHRFTNATQAPTRFLVIASPAGIEEFFAEFATPISSLTDTPPPVTPELIARLLAVAPAHGIEILPPPGAA